MHIDYKKNIYLTRVKGQTTQPKPLGFVWEFEGEVMGGILKKGKDLVKKQNDLGGEGFEVFIFIQNPKKNP